MANWKKVIVSGSQAELRNLTASLGINVTGSANMQKVSASIGINAALPTIESSKYVVINSDGDFGQQNLPTIPAAASNATITLTAGDGLKTGGAFTTNQSSNEEIIFNIDVDAMAGVGLTADNTNEELDVSAAQTGITSVLNTGLVVGRDATDQIKFSTDNKIIFRVNDGDNIIFDANGHITASGISVSGRINGSGGITGSLQGTASFAGSSSFVNSLEGGTLADGNLILGNASNIAEAQSITGVIGITRGGVTTYVNNSVTKEALNTGVAGNGLSGGDGTALSVDYGSSANDAVEGNTTISLTGTSNEVEITGTTAQALGGGPSYTIGLPNDVTIGNDLTVTGDLIVNGDTTQLSVTNLNVDDQFILLNSGSNSGDGGIIVQTAGAGGTHIGAGLGFDDSLGRWVISSKDQIAHNATAFAPNAQGAPQMLVAVSSSADGAPSGDPTDFGAAAASRVGLMFVDTSTEDIYIFS